MRDKISAAISANCIFQQRNLQIESIEEIETRFTACSNTAELR
jgi:hypothetical protein